jgi:receptor-type tyrosine-protein phosphatase O
VTLLWVEEGVADFFEVFCQQLGSGHNGKLQVLIASTIFLNYF